MQQVAVRQRRMDWLAGTIVAVLGVPVIVIGIVGTLYGLLGRRSPVVPLPDAPPPDFLSQYGFVLGFAAIGVGGVLMIFVGIAVARHHQLGRVIALLISIGGVWFAWTLLQNFLRPGSYSMPPSGGSLVPNYDTQALLGAVALGIPLLVATSCLVITIVRGADLRR